MTVLSLKYTYHATHLSKVTLVRVAINYTAEPTLKVRPQALNAPPALAPPEAQFLTYNGASGSQKDACGNRAWVVTPMRTRPVAPDDGVPRHAPGLSPRAAACGGTPPIVPHHIDVPGTFWRRRRVRVVAVACILVRASHELEGSAAAVILARPHSRRSRKGNAESSRYPAHISAPSQRPNLDEVASPPRSDPDARRSADRQTDHATHIPWVAGI